MNRYLIAIVITVSLLRSGAVLTGCANIVPPSGGPRDSLPPVLIKATPPDSSRGVTGTKFTFSFNEFIDIQNAQQSLLISPLPRNFPQVDFRLNTMTVRWKDSLESGTTYTLQFGDAVKDFNEGNIRKNFTYTFSTGPFLDSLQLYGSVVLAETGKADTTLIVMLHTSEEDSAVVKERPRYIARLDGKGRFLFRNLPPKRFFLYALKDDGGGRRYLDDKQLFAFAPGPVYPALKIDSIELFAYASKTPPIASLKSGLGTGKSKAVTTADKRLRYQTNLTGNQQDLLDSLRFTFELPLKSLDSAGIRLCTDSSFQRSDPPILLLDSTKKIVTLATAWKENTDYHLILEKTFATDTAGRQLLKTDTLSFRTKKRSDYGSLRLSWKQTDTLRHLVLQLLTGESLFRTYPLRGNGIEEPLFKPGEYELRLLDDTNDNGLWDPGDFFNGRRPPEIAKPLGKKLNVKPGIRNELDLPL